MVEAEMRKGLFWNRIKKGREYAWVFAILASSTTIDSVQGRLPRVFNGS